MFCFRPIASLVLSIALPCSAGAENLTLAVQAQADYPSSCCTSAIIDYVKNYRIEPFSFAIGNADGPCCILNTPPGIAKGLLYWTHITAETKMPVFSSSKWVTAFVILRLIDEGKFTLDTHASDILDWWTNDPSDKRSLVTVRHLLAQIDGMSTYKILGISAIGACPASDTIGCAKYAYKNLFEWNIGEVWCYSDTSFHVLGAMALKATGHTDYNEVFQAYVAKPLGMKNAEFKKRVLIMKGDPGANLVISLNDYSKLMQKILAQTFVSADLHRESERIHTLGVPDGIFIDGKKKPMPMIIDPNYRMHYNLGNWRACEPAGTCADDEGILLHSSGAQGFFPYLWRKGCESHWGILARQGSILTGPADSAANMEKLLPLAREAMANMPCVTTTTTTASAFNSAELLSGADARCSMRPARICLIVLASVLIYASIKNA